ncbi:sigma 54-interacting transcriptional regulator [Sorangium sp. So ce1182]
MSSLFGHTKGSFTGALKDRPGLLRKAHEGVLFLDEIGELGADEQAMLLRALEEKAFLPVGSDREVRTGRYVASSSCSPARTGIYRWRSRRGASGKTCWRGERVLASTDLAELDRWSCRAAVVSGDREILAHAGMHRGTWAMPQRV